MINKHTQTHTLFQARVQPYLEAFKYAPNVVYLHSDERYDRREYMEE